MSNHPRAGDAPKKIYLDQNVYGHMLDEGRGDWRNSDIGSLLERAKTSGKGLVWIGPTHIVETLLTTDAERRRTLARTMLEVVDFTRIWHGYELELVVEFFDFLRRVSPACIHTEFFLKQALEDHPRICLAALALLALGAPIDAAQAEAVRRIKLQNRLLHARLATDPNHWVDRMLQAAKRWETTRENVFAELEAMSNAELIQQIESLRAGARKLDKKHFDRLNRERATIAAAYGALDVTAGLELAFTSPMSLDLTLDTAALVADWPTQQAKLGLRSMPKDVMSAPSERQSFDAEMRLVIIDTAIQAWASKLPLTPSLSYESLLRELQRKLNDRQLPTEGVILDADHAGCLRRVDIFYTEDMLLGEIARGLCSITNDLTNGAHHPSAGTSAAELAELIGIPHQLG